jgi:hypothetical protein
LARTLEYVEQTRMGGEAADGEPGEHKKRAYEAAQPPCRHWLLPSRWCGESWMFHDGATVRRSGKVIGRATVRGSAKSNRSVGTTPPAGRNLFTGKSPT